MMADQFKIDGDGKCSACNSLSVKGEHVLCFACKDYFHAVYFSVNADTSRTFAIPINFELISHHVLNQENQTAN
jgi:hypothetical protein